jgi:uncharacterized membrane protein YtjA (UPF0391 family)
MLKWGFVFVVIAVIAGALGFGHGSGAVATIFGGLFFVFIAIAVFTFFAAVMAPRQPLRR